MKYLVYTDASTKQGCPPAVGFFIRTRYNFIAFDCFTLKGQYKINVAESIAVGKAVSFLLEKLPLSQDDSVEIFIDSYSTINWFEANRYGEPPKWYAARALEKSLSDFKRLCGKTSVTLTKIGAHSPQDVSGNTVADRLASTVARLNREETL